MRIKETWQDIWRWPKREYPGLKFLIASVGKRNEGNALRGVRVVEYCNRRGC